MKTKLSRCFLVLGLSVLGLPPLVGSLSIADERQFSVRPEVSEDAQYSFEDFDALERAAREGDADALNSLGVFHFRDEEFSEAADCFRRAAEKGHPIAMFNFGLMQLHGWGVPQSHADASESFITSARHGVVAAQYNLGMLHLHGIDGAVDLDVGVYWLTKSAEQGFASAQNNLGNVFLSGIGVDADPQAAAEWYRRAVDQGNSYAQSTLGQMLLSGRDVPLDLDEAARLLRSAAEQGVSEARYHYGMMFMMGHGVPEDSEKARTLIQQAAEGGHLEAKVNLGKLYLTGRGGELDSEAGISWIRKAADEGSEEAQFLLGSFYQLGQGVSQDSAVAFEWLRRAADQGHTQAQFHVGTGYAVGIAGEADFKMAYRWLIMAKLGGHPQAGQILEEVAKQLDPEAIAGIESELRGASPPGPETVEPGGVRDSPEKLEEIEKIAADQIALRLPKDFELPSLGRILSDYELAQRTDRVMSRITREEEFLSYYRDRTAGPDPSIQDETDILLAYVREKADVPADVRAWLELFSSIVYGLPWKEGLKAYDEVETHRPADLQPKMIMLLTAAMPEFTQLSTQQWEEWAGIFDSAFPLAGSEKEEVVLLHLAATAIPNFQKRAEAAGIVQQVWSTVRNVQRRYENNEYIELSTANRTYIALAAGAHIEAAELARHSNLRSMAPLFLVGTGIDEALGAMEELRRDENLRVEEETFLELTEALILTAAGRLDEAGEVIEKARTERPLTANDKRLLDALTEVLNARGKEVD